MVGTISDPTIAFLAVALVGHVLIATTSALVGHQIEALDVGILVVDISAIAQLVIRINLDTIRMVARAIRGDS